MFGSHLVLVQVQLMIQGSSSKSLSVRRFDEKSEHVRGTMAKIVMLLTEPPSYLVVETKCGEIRSIH